MADDPHRRLDNRERPYGEFNDSSARLVNVNASRRQESSFSAAADQHVNSGAPRTGASIVPTYNEFRARTYSNSSSNSGKNTASSFTTRNLHIDTTGATSNRPGLQSFNTPFASMSSSSISTGGSSAGGGVSSNIADPLTPRSRRALNSESSHATGSTVSNSLTINTTDMGVYKSNDGAPLSPHKALLNLLDSADIKTTKTSATIGEGGSNFSSGLATNASVAGGSSQQHQGASSFASRLVSIYSGSGASASAGAFGAATTGSGHSMHHESIRSREQQKERLRCGAEIFYNSVVRIRLNNHQCLRVSTSNLSGTTAGSASSVSSSSTMVGTGKRWKDGSSKHRHRTTPGQIEVTGNGLNGDDDQLFVLLNASMRVDTGEVHYSDVVALYCVAGSCKGHFLSADPVTHLLSTKKGPVISNAEKWRLINPNVGTEILEESGIFEDAIRSGRDETFTPTSGLTGVAQDSFFSLNTSKVAWEQQQKVLTTSDKVLFKMYSTDLFLSVRSEAYSRESIHYVVGLSKKNDGINDALQVWEITKSNIPYDPSWNREREYLTGEALVQPRTSRHPEVDHGDLNLPPLSTYPPSIQESIILDDLLYTFVGIEGRYIKLDVQETSTDIAKAVWACKFRLDQYGMDPSVSSLAARCFPLGEFFLKLKLYVEQFSRYEYGQVNHAFCAALKSLLKEYTIVIAQLEHQMKGSATATRGSFTIQKLWYYIQPSLRTMEMLTMLVDACRKTLGGGSLLSEIQRIKSSLAGDQKACQVFSFLMARSSVPYLKMVERWIYHGDLVDSYDEFMVRRDAEISKEDVTDNPYSTYWQDRYTLREAQVPLFLSRLAPKILTAGKYLNVFRTCNRQVDCPFAGTIEFAESESAYEELIDKAHGFASQMLLDLFMKENDLANRFISLKHYFLMDQGDFFVDFMDVAEEELKLRADKLSISRLESLLHLSLQTSTCSSDPYKDDLVCFLSSHNLISQMEAIHERAQKGPRDSLTTMAASSMSHPGYKVIDAFTLDYKVQWPLALIISCGALTKYQMIFRHLFFCKHVERRLCDAWLNHQTTKELSLRSALGPSFCLRQRMLHFQQNFVYYMMFEVISPRWHAFQKQLATVETVDDILDHHRDFLDICLKECLLTDPDLLRVLTKLMTVCMTFANSIECFTRPYFMDEETIKAEREAERDRRAEKKAREEAELALASYQRINGGVGAGKKKGGALKRRQSSQVDMRRARIKELSEDVKRALTEREGNNENPFARMTSDLENQFDSLLGEFMQQLLRRSLLQRNSHLSNLCTRLDYNGFYTK